MKKIMVDLGRYRYPVIIVPHGLSQIGHKIQEFCSVKKAALITDRTVKRLYGRQVNRCLLNGGLQTKIFEVPDGENSKSLNQANHLYTALIQNNFHRDDCIIALGGGVVGDLAGFIAATYLRGIPFFQIPTTLLAQVDSSIGGKVGINHELGKNLIGSFYQPKCVLIDPEVLKTLDRREIWSGLGEVVKYGMILGGPLFRLIQSHIDSIASLEDMDMICEMLELCCQCKAQVVMQDEKESGLRRILNLGHTIGHALEAAGNFQYYRHGEAVVHGIRWALCVSYKKQYINEKDWSTMDSLLKRFPIPPIPKNVTTKNLISIIKKDKKQTKKGLDVILIKQPGQVEIEKSTRLSETINDWLAHVRI